jgi:hypothetical protein
MEHETFFTLICDLAHWEFELFILVICDVFIGALLWPQLKRWTKHHKSDDQQLADLQEQVAEIQRKLGIEPTHSPNDEEKT